MPRTLGCAPRRVGAGGSIVGAVRTVGGLGVSPVLDAPSVMLTQRDCAWLHEVLDDLVHPGASFDHLRSPRPVRP